MVEAIRRGGDSPERLELEITESVVMRNVEDSTRKLSILRDMGVTVAIDDFGTGYSSLSYLGRLPLDSLKIDRSFVSGMTAGGEAASIVATIITLAHGLRLKVVAEGVETGEQANLLKLLRCDEAQGYLYANPLPGERIEALLRERPGPSSRPQHSLPRPLAGRRIILQKIYRRQQRQVQSAFASSYPLRSRPFHWSLRDL
jgi:EAL domain-containing protein (putative c-di-GMP-specific phosphodiesterase class I)